MRSSIIPAALTLAVVALAAPSSAQAPGYGAPSAAPPPGYYNRMRARAPRPYVDIPAARQGGWVPYWQRGFEDPGYAYHGNINGCAVDLGYGRWEPCNAGR
jgi:hypothetical protein